MTPEENDVWQTEFWSDDHVDSDAEIHYDYNTSDEAENFLITEQGVIDNYLEQERNVIDFEGELVALEFPVENSLFMEDICQIAVSQVLDFPPKNTKKVFIDLTDELVASQILDFPPTKKTSNLSFETIRKRKHNGKST